MLISWAFNAQLISVPLFLHVQIARCSTKQVDGISFTNAEVQRFCIIYIYYYKVFFIYLLLRLTIFCEYLLRYLKCLDICFQILQQRAMILFWIILFIDSVYSLLNHLNKK